MDFITLDGHTFLRDQITPKKILDLGANHGSFDYKLGTRFVDTLFIKQ